MAKRNQASEIDTAEDPGVVAKVEQMMEPEPKSVKDSSAPEFSADKLETESTAAKPDTNDLPPLDIFADTPSAPLLDKKKPTTKAKTKTANKPKPKEETSEPEAIKITVNRLPKPPLDAPIEPEASTNQVTVISTKPDDFDDPETTEAIDDIVASEGDVALEAHDQKQSRKNAIPVPKEARTHKFFWGLVAVLCLLAIAMAVFLINPSIHNPISKLHWSSIKRHL